MSWSLPRCTQLVGWLDHLIKKTNMTLPENFNQFIIHKWTHTACNWKRCQQSAFVSYGRPRLWSPLIFFELFKKLNKRSFEFLVNKYVQGDLSQARLHSSEFGSQIGQDLSFFWETMGRSPRSQIWCFACWIYANRWPSLWAARSASKSAPWFWLCSRRRTRSGLSLTLTIWTRCEPNWLG